jgi:cell shape-determining protein MreD
MWRWTVFFHIILSSYSIPYLSISGKLELQSESVKHGKWIAEFLLPCCSFSPVSYIMFAVPRSIEVQIKKFLIIGSANS